MTPPPQPPTNRSRTIYYHRPEEDKTKLFERPGIEQLRAMVDGLMPPPPISSHIGLEIISVADGDVVMTAQPDESHYNPVGSVHGGFFATVLDSVCGCAVHSTLPSGVGYTSLEIKVSFLRPITAETGTVTAHGWVTRRGKSAAFADADIRDRAGQVLATASSTCLIIHPGPAR
ncbi:PaaI family thioesterase [Salinibacterium sp. ZJ450]|uniref:PaaI family thioesterase n=1 Tax=Salinibacterium sp. ZJ450 TaxID=2708338 RepID=UPI001421908E|nr:PaaI family thioesterase [Salinibacterium sp. ZJ450]